MARLLALGGVAGPIIFTVMTVAMAALRPGYSHASMFISELGAAGTSNAHLMNFAAFVPTGLLLAAFGGELGHAMTGRWEKVGAVFVVLFGTGIFLDGLLACDPGCPQGSGSLANQIHNAVAPAVFVLVTIAIGIFGARFRRLEEWRALAAYSIASSLVAAVTFVGLAQSINARVTTGLWQRAFLTTVFLWCAVIGLRLARRRTAL